MKSWMIARRTFLAAALATGLAGSAMADGHQVVDSIHFLIPGGAGGGCERCRVRGSVADSRPGVGEEAEIR